LILILLLTGTATSQSLGELDVYTTGSQLTGQVVDASGSGISGARIWIIGGEGQATNTATNATGYYGMNVTPGNYTITAELSGYSFTSSTVQVWGGAASIAPRITGYAAGSVPSTSIAPATTAGFYQYGQPYYSGGMGWVQGRVADQSGAGIPFASFTIDGFRTSYSTDEQGNYRIMLSPGMHRIDPMSSGYGIPPRAVFITSGQTTNLDMIAKGTVALGSGRLR
jgi:uncharacterized membrane protein